jgi:peroxiredoxin
MAFLRSLFVSTYLAYLLVASVYALAQLARGTDPLLAWLGMGLAALGPLSFFAWILMSKPPRTARHPVEYSVIGALGLAIAMATSWRHGEAAGAAHGWAAVAVFGWLVYLRWYSTFRQRDATGLEPGDALPDFPLRNLDGESVNSSLFRGRTHVLVFYRGNWCPFCTAQVGELAGRYRELEDAGATVVLISPQPVPKHRELARRHAVPLQFLQDAGNEAARRLGILDRWGVPLGMQLLGYASDTALPTVIISDAQGRIVYSDLTDNYRIRPEPEQFLEVLGTAPAS